MLLVLCVCAIVGFREIEIAQEVGEQVNVAFTLRRVKFSGINVGWLVIPIAGITHRELESI